MRRVKIEAVDYLRGDPPDMGHYLIVKDGEQTEDAIKRRLKRYGLCSSVRSGGCNRQQDRTYHRQYAVTAGKRVDRNAFSNSMEFLIETDEQQRP